jgi:3-methyladenine DNA glycosylase AlkD
VVPSLLARLRETYGAARDSERAGPMVAYMRDRFAYLGIAAPERERLNRAVVLGSPPPSEDDLSELALGCWALPEREYQYFAAWYVRRWIPRVPASPAFLDTLEQLIATKSWWDTVDELAAHGVGPLVALHPELVNSMDWWIRSDDIWLARTALLYQQRYKAATDVDRLFGYCLRRAADPEWFIRKAIGWALREYSKTDGEAVRRFVAEHGSELAPLSQREALKWLDRRPPTAGRSARSPQPAATAGPRPATAGAASKRVPSRGPFSTTNPRPPRTRPA